MQSIENCTVKMRNLSMMLREDMQSAEGRADGAGPKCDASKDRNLRCNFQKRRLEIKGIIVNRSNYVGDFEKSGMNCGISAQIFSETDEKSKIFLNFLTLYMCRNFVL